MKIKAKTVYDLNVYKALNDAVVFKGKDPAYCKALTLGLVCMIILRYSAFIILGSQLSGNQLDSTSFVPSFILFLLALYCVFSWFINPRLLSKQVSSAEEGLIENVYEFGEDCIAVESSSQKVNVSAKVDYSSLTKAVETSDYIFLFGKESASYAVDKSSFEGGGLEEARNKLQLELGKKYKIAKY